MESISAEKLKRELHVKDWSEIKTPEQFYLLMQHFHNLSPRLRNKVLSEISDLEEKMEQFLKHCIDGIVDYEPSIMMAMIDKWTVLKQSIEAERMADTPKTKKSRMELFMDFSKWFSLYGEVKCTRGFSEVICSISDAVKLAIKNDEMKEHEQVDMLLMTDTRKLLQEKMEAMKLYDTDVDRELLLEYLGEDAEAFDMLELKKNMYLN